MPLIVLAMIKVTESPHSLREGATAGITSLAPIVVLEQIAKVPGQRRMDAVIAAAMGVEQAHFSSAVEQRDALFARQSAHTLQAPLGVRIAHCS